MQIFGPYRVSTPQPTNNVSRTNQVVENRATSGSSQPVDQLDLSSEAQEINRLSGANETGVVDGIRFDKVADIRRQIADGSYDTDDKLSAALDRLLDEVG
ncbi:Anti-sigma-28 factor, FlgM [Rosistilla oblonga]|uniref:Anti-sigma-28 factor, FlgM n=1 Tax=Rosistilla oblonga TaxID=2527990 RepID=A0A518IPT4_9BACT|nr:Anti-sigma-28 factor, FlgM [Rosistilla oblonga]